MDDRDVQSMLGLMIQGAGIGLLALLCAFLVRSVRRVYLNYWAAAWGFYAAALAFLFLSFRVPPLSTAIESLYYAGEYAFAFFLVAGFRNLRDGSRLGRGAAWLALPAVALALFLPHTAISFTARFVPQALVLAVAFGLALVQLERLRRARETTPGLRLASVALAVLVLNFLHYVPVLSYAAWRGITLPLAYSAYTSIYDLILEVLLGFGMVTLVMEDSRREAETAARTDQLTQSLNRHAFYSMVESRRAAGEAPPPGCVAVVDVDELKPINDTLGHAAGDAVIRAVAKALRSLVRPDDLVFRWGGDEFLVVLLGLGEDEARRRLEGLPGLLARVALPGGAGPVTAGASWGVAAFALGEPLEAAIAAADAAMYRRKQATRQRRRSAS